MTKIVPLCFYSKCDSIQSTTFFSMFLDVGDIIGCWESFSMLGMLSDVGDVFWVLGMFFKFYRVFSSNFLLEKCKRLKTIPKSSSNYHEIIIKLTVMPATQISIYFSSLPKFPKILIAAYCLLFFIFCVTHWIIEHHVGLHWIKMKQVNVYKILRKNSRV